MTTTIPLRETETRHLSGAWTAIGSLLMLAVIAQVTGGFERAFTEARQFFSLSSVTGGSPLQALQVNSLGFLVGLTIMGLLCALPSIAVVQTVCGIPRQMPRLFHNTTRVPLFAMIMITLIAEELFARLLFMGVLGHFWQGSLATYVLFLTGNTLWALFHLSNFKEQEDRHALRVLPQFIAGIFFAIAFVEHGFFAALLVHVAYDMVLFSMNKRNAFNGAEVASIVINVISLGLGLFFIGKPLSDLTRWTQFDGSFTIPGWGFWNYFWAVVIVGSILTIIGDLLAFDHEKPEEVSGILTRALVSVLAVGIVLLGYWIISWTTPSTLMRLLILSIALLFFHTSGSGSNLARAFWISIPSSILLLCALFALEGFWLKVGLVLAISIFNIPEEAVRNIDA